MKKKVGPLQIWQWGAIVGGGLGLFLLLHKKKGAEPGEEQTLGPLKVGMGPEGGFGAGAGGGSLGGSVGGEGLSGTPGPVGSPGPAGEPGAPGAPGRELTPQEETALSAAAHALNNPPIGPARTSKPLATRARSKVKKPRKSSKPAAHKAIHRQAQKERRSTVRVPPAQHARTGAGAVAHRSHGTPKPLSVRRAGAPHPSLNAAQHPAAPHSKPAARTPPKPPTRKLGVRGRH